MTYKADLKCVAYHPSKYENPMKKALLNAWKAETEFTNRLMPVWMQAIFGAVFGYIVGKIILSFIF